MERERWETEEFFVKGSINVFDETEVFDKDRGWRVLSSTVWWHISYLLTSVGTGMK
jgi:hypothetical protein